MTANAFSRARAAYIGWTLLTGLLIVIGIAAAVQGILSLDDGGILPAIAGPAVVWFGLWVWLCARVVWTYRRQVPELAASDDPYDQRMAQKHAAVAMQFTLRQLSGVRLDGVTRTPLARFVDGQWPLVGHVAAIGLIVIAASLE